MQSVPELSQPGRSWKRALAWLGVLLLLVVAGVQSWRSLTWIFRGDKSLAGLSSFWLAVVALLAVGLLCSLGALVMVLKRPRLLVTQPAPWWLLRFAFCAVVLWALWLQSRTELVGRVEFESLLGLPLAVSAILALVGPRLARGLPARSLRIADLVLFNLCLTPVLIEIGLRSVSLWSRSQVFSTVDQSIRAQMARFHQKPREMLAGFACDADGYHDEPLRPAGADGRTVVAIGDSFQVGIVPHLYHYTTVVERCLPWCQVYSMGINAIGPRIYLHLLKYEALPKRPDAILLSIFVGNDIVEAGSYSNLPQNLYRRSLAFLDPSQAMIRLVPERISRVRTELGKLGRIGMDMRPRLGLLEQSGESIRAAMPFWFDPSQEEATFTEERFLGIERDRIKGVCGSKEDAYKTFFEDMQLIIEACGSTPLYVMLIPDEFQVEDSVWEATTLGAGPALDRFKPQAKLVPWFKERGIACLDLLPILRAIEPGPDGNRHLYKLRDTHINIAGNRVVGEAIARFLEPIGPRIEVLRFETQSPQIRLDKPGLPTPMPILAIDKQGRPRDLKALLPGGKFTSSDPSVVAVTGKGELVAQQRGSARVTLASGEAELTVEVVADWPAVIDLGGGSPIEGATKLEVVADGEGGRPSGLMVTGAPAGSWGALFCLARPALGWVRSSDPWPYFQGSMVGVPLTAGPQGSARFDSLPPGKPGRPLYFVAQFEKEAVPGSKLFSNVIAITPD